MIRLLQHPLLEAVVPIEMYVSVNAHLFPFSSSDVMGSM
jgi:hypothetical protein